MFKAINQGEESFSSLDFNRPVECTSAMASFLVEKQRCTGNNRTNYCVNYLLICINYWSVSQLINKLSFHLSSLYTAVSPSINLTVGILPHVPSLNNMAAWLDGHNNPSSWQWRYRNEGETWMGGVKGGIPLSPLTPCHSSTKVTPGGGDGAESGQRATERKTQTPSFVCRIVCLLAPFLCRLTLPSSPLLAVSNLSLSSSPLWPCPLLIPRSLPFVCQASIRSSFALHPPAAQFPSRATFPPATCLSFAPPLPLVPSLHYYQNGCCRNCLFGNGGREIIPELCPTILILTSDA